MRISSINNKIPKNIIILSFAIANLINILASTLILAPLNQQMVLKTASKNPWLYLPQIYSSALVRLNLWLFTPILAKI